MIPMLSLSLLSFAKAELLIQTNLKEHYIAGQPIFVDIQIQNIGESVETLPNLEKQTALLQWSIENTNGKQKIQSKEIENKDTWTLEPRQLKEVRFLLPNSSALPVGKQQLSLQIDLPQPYTQTKEIYIHKPSPLWDDREIREEQAFFPEGYYLWGQATSKKEQIVFLETERSIPLFIAPIQERFQQTISHQDNHLYSLHEEQLLLHTLEREEIQKTQKISFPWKQVSNFTRGITDPEQRFHLPIWISDPKSNSGTLRSIIITHDGSISYRKIISLPERPLSIDSALTSAGVPLYLIQTSNRIYLFPLTQTGNQKIDLLPPQNITIRNTTKEDDIDVQFGIDSEAGLIIHVLEKKEDVFLSKVYSLQGKQQNNKTVALPSKNTTITESHYQESKLFLLGKDENFWYQFSEENWTKLNVSDYPAHQNFKLDSKQSAEKASILYSPPSGDEN